MLVWLDDVTKRRLAIDALRASEARLIWPLPGPGRRSGKSTSAGARRGGRRVLPDARLPGRPGAANRRECLGAPYPSGGCRPRHPRESASICMQSSSRQRPGGDVRRLRGDLPACAGSTAASSGWSRKDGAAPTNSDAGGVSTASCSTSPRRSGPSRRCIRRSRASSRRRRWRRWARWSRVWRMRSTRRWGTRSPRRRISPTRWRSPLLGDAGENRLRRSDLVAFIGVLSETTRLMLANCERAAELVQSFKQVAVDQTSGERRRFDLKGYRGNIAQPAAAAAENRPPDRGLVPPNLEVDGYPGAVSQLLTNFLLQLADACL